MFPLPDFRLRLTENVGPVQKDDLVGAMVERVESAIHEIKSERKVASQRKLQTRCVTSQSEADSDAETQHLVVLR
jgi:hypothetical protein